MLKLDIYPVMDGVELWAVGRCLKEENGHHEHQSVREATYISRERIDTGDLVQILINEVALLLHEFPELAERARC